MQWTVKNGRMQPNSFETNRAIIEVYDEIARSLEVRSRSQEARFELREQLSRSRRLLDEAHELLAKVKKQVP